MISEVVAKWNEKSDQKLWFFKYLPFMSMPDSILWASALFLVQFNKPEVIETGCVKGIYVAFPITLTIFRHLLKYKSSHGPFDESFLNKFGGVIFSQWCHLLVILKWIKMTLFVSFMFHFLSSRTWVGFICWMFSVQIFSKSQGQSDPIFQKIKVEKSWVTIFLFLRFSFSNGG